VSGGTKPKKTREEIELEILVERPIDHPDADLFGFSDAVDLTVRFFRKCPRPVLFAVYGRSGSGRSSFLKLMEHALRSEDGYAQLHFDCRPFRRSETLIRPLLRNVEKCLEIDDPIYTRLKATASGPPSASEPAFDDWVDSIEGMREHLERSIKEGLVKKGLKALLITVDGVDLCKASLKLELIEFIAEFLNVEPLVLVITVDRKQLTSDYLASRIFVAERQASLYLDRIFPHAYTIPWIGEDQLIDYVIDATGRLGLLNMERSRKNRTYTRFRRMVEVYLRRAAVTPIKIVRELVKFCRMHKLATAHEVVLPNAPSPSFSSPSSPTSTASSSTRASAASGISSASTTPTRTSPTPASQSATGGASTECSRTPPCATCSSPSISRRPTGMTS